MVLTAIDSNSASNQLWTINKTMEFKPTYVPTQEFNACWKMILNKLMQSNSPHHHGAVQLLRNLTLIDGGRMVL